MKAESYHTALVRSALLLGLFTTSAAVAQSAPQESAHLSSSSDGLLANFDTTAAPAALPAAPAPQLPAHHIETSVSLGVDAQLTATRVSDNSTAFVTQSLAPSAGLLAAFRQQFAPWLGYSVNFGYSRATYRYTHNATGGVNSGSFVSNDLYEASFAYVAQRHLTGRLTGFADAGGGMVALSPISSSGPAINPTLSTSYRPEGLAGVGVDYHLRSSLSLRAEYRGLIYKLPDYDSDNAKLTTLSSEPTFSLTYTFGNRSKH